MNFLSPLSLLIFIPLGAVIVILYLLKLKRKERVVSSVMLWRDAVADIQANAPFQKLKKSLLLFLQLAALLLLVIALARPYMRVQGLSENRIVTILDCSASMQATDVSPSRFDAARSKAIDIVNKMGPGDTMMVMTAGSKAKVVASFTSDKKVLTGAISSLKPMDTPCNMRQAMVLALSLVSGKTSAPARVAVLSDGGFGDLMDLAAKGVQIDFLKIGRQCDNVGITGLASRKTLSGEQQIFIGLQNFSKRARSFNLEMYVNDQLLDIREESMKAGETRQEILGKVANVRGRVTAKLDIKDDLAADNTGSVYVSGPRKISVLLISKGDIFLQNALNLDPRSQVTKAESAPADLSKSKYDLVVFDGVKPPSNLPQGGYLLVNTSADQGPASLGEAVERPAVIDSSSRHPVAAYVDFSNAHILKADYMQPKPWATTFMEGPGGALGVAGTKDGKNFVQLSWSLLDSDFPLRVGFPIFVANCLDWLAPSEKSGAGMSGRTGQTMYIDVPTSVPEITVTNPDGAEQKIKVTQTPVTYDNTDRAGVYHVTGTGMKKEFACNLSSSQESNTTPISTLEVGGKSLSSKGSDVLTNREFYWPLILVALAVLVFEWYAYHRRI